MTTCDTGPPSHTFGTRGRSDYFTVGQTRNVYRYALFLTRNPYVFWIAKFRKKLSERARSDRASRNLRRLAWRVTGGGTVDSLPWVTERGCPEFQPTQVQTASRSCRTAYITRDPRFSPFPTQNGPTGFPRRPRRAVVVISRRQTLARTSRGTNQRIHAGREGLAARFWLPSSFPPCTTHDSRTSQSNSQPACRFTGPMPLRRTFIVLSKEFAGFPGVYS
jgi:hypothetical protein